MLALLAWDLYRIRTNLDAGRRSLDGLTLEAAATTGLTELATDAAGHLSDAASRADRSIPLSLAAHLPVVGDQVDGIRRMTGVTADLGASGLATAERLDAELERAGEPEGRVALLELALVEIDRIAGELAEVDLGSGDRLRGPLRGAHDDLVDTIERAREKLDEGRMLVEPVRDLLAGPSSFLLLAANNAEMGGGAGLALSAGLLTFENGEIELGDVVAAGDLRLDSTRPLPGDLRKIYRPTGIGVDFRSTTRTPNLPAMGPVVANMIQAKSGAAIDGVVVVDAIALRDVMEITGGVTVDGKAIDADNVLAEVLNENYKAFETTEERPERVAYQGEIAKAVFEALTEQDVPAAALADAMLDTSVGRHLMLWSANEALQQVWSELGIAGELDERGLLISFQNYAANKLDWYLRPEADLDVTLSPSGNYRARLTMRLPVPALSELEDASSYILGPGPELQGTFLTVHLPAAAYDITTPDPRGFRTKGIDGPTQVRTFLVDVPAGTTLERQIDFSLPREHPTMLLLPSARIEPLPLTVDGVATVDDDEPLVISWLAAIPPPGPDRGAPLPVQVLAVVGLALNLAAAGAGTVAVARRRDPTTDIRTWIGAGKAAAALALATFALAALLALMAASPRV